MAPPSVTLTIVGDVHRFWRDEDERFLVDQHRAESGTALFVGDLGDEDLEMVRKVADLPVPKAVMLGNHDAWQSFSSRGVTPNLRASVEILGDDHFGYGLRELPGAKMSLVGARPFSWGGPNLRSPQVYEQLYGVRTMKQSAARIVEAARMAQHRDIVILAHNGPTGLSQRSQDIYGKDFGRPGGDWGDRDLEVALERIAGLGLRVRLVIAGHMHSRLMYPRGGERERFVRHREVLYANPAVVPRVQTRNGHELAYYLRARLQAGRCVGLEEIWVDRDGVVRESRAPEVRELQEVPRGGS